MKIPDKIYLQYYDSEGEVEDLEYMTWSIDRINDTDIEYVRSKK